MSVSIARDLIKKRLFIDYGIESNNIIITEIRDNWDLIIKFQLDNENYTYKRDITGGKIY